MKAIRVLLIVGLTTVSLRATYALERILNRDQLYFSDTGRITQVPRETTTVDVQKSVELQSQVDQNYFQAIPNQNIAQYANQAAPVTPFIMPAVYMPTDNYYAIYNAMRPDWLNPGKQAQGQLPAPNVDQQLPIVQNSEFNRNSEVPQSNNPNLQPHREPNPLRVIPLRQPSSNFSQAITGFGLSVLKNVNTPLENTVISPFSIATLLALLQQGAFGQTYQELTNVLQMTSEYAVKAFDNTNQDIQKRSSRSILRLANNIFVADAFDINPAFKKVAKSQFHSEVTPTKFYSSDAVPRINQWVASKTNNKINQLLGPDAVGENTQMVLVNAVYFKGLWAVKFKPESTRPSSFQLRNGVAKTVPFMAMRGSFKTGFDSATNAQVLIMPFENDEYSLMVLLPVMEANLDTMLSSLNGAQLSNYQNFSIRDVALTIPKFTVRADTDLNPVFRKMGLSSIFGQQSELSGLGTYRTHSPQVSGAVHSAMLAIDEDGGSAAAATAFVVVALSYDDPSITFNANRPFLAVLWDNKANLPLFMARVENPS